MAMSANGATVGQPPLPGQQSSQPNGAPQAGHPPALPPNMQMVLANMSKEKLQSLIAVSAMSPVIVAAAWVPFPLLTAPLLLSCSLCSA